MRNPFERKRVPYTFLSYVYWGEYPLSFAACLGQEECYRLILARGADPDKQDTNGNTVLHMLVIYEKLVSGVGLVMLCSVTFKFNNTMQSISIDTYTAQLVGTFDSSPSYGLHFVH